MYENLCFRISFVEYKVVGSNMPKVWSGQLMHMQLIRADKIKEDDWYNDV